MNGRGASYLSAVRNAFCWFSLRSLFELKRFEIVNRRGSEMSRKSRESRLLRCSHWLLSQRALLLALVTCLAASAARGDVWETKKQWDDGDDLAFGQWIKKLPMDVFTAADSPYKGISTDCAKAVYALRVIFAYEHGLPVSFIGRGAARLSNDNKDFDDVAEGLPRLLKFISFVKSHVDTRSLVNDTYPVKINRHFVRSGAVFLHPASKNVPVTYQAGHVYYIQDVYENGMVRYFSSTVPSMVRDLQPRVDITFAPFGKTGGFRAWKRPYSDEQPGFDDADQFRLADWRPNAWRDGKLWSKWARAVRRRLQLRPATVEEELGAKIENVDGYIKERRQLVQRSWRHYQEKYGGRSCMNAADYDAYSTPTRDVKIQNELSDLRYAAVSYLMARSGTWNQRMLEDLFSRYRWQVLPGVSVDLNHLWTTFETRVVLAISEPEHSPEVRWGRRSQDAWPCPERKKQYNGGE